MRAVVCAIVLVTLLSLRPLGARSESAASEPAIVFANQSHVLVLPDGIRSALAEYDPTFRVRQDVDYSPSTRETYEYTARQAPFAAIGDFNGNGRLDVVVDGDSERVGRRLLVLSEGQAYAVRELNSFDKLTEDILKYRRDPSAERHPESGPGYGVSLLEAGRHQSPFEEHPLELKNDGWIAHALGKAACASYLEGDEVKSYVLGD